MINDKNSNLIAFKVGNSQSSDEVIMMYIDKQVLEFKTQPNIQEYILINDCAEIDISSK